MEQDDLPLSCEHVENWEGYSTDFVVYDEAKLNLSSNSDPVERGVIPGSEFS